MRSELSDTTFQNNQTLAVEPDFYILERYGFRDSAILMIEDNTPRVLADPAIFQS
jgi:Xaa-Pro aminopeptidase